MEEWVHIIRENVKNNTNGPVYSIIAAFASKESCLILVCERTNWQVNK